MKPQGEFTSYIWDSIQATYLEIMEHPFVTQLAHGTLAAPCFAHYLAQDILYIRDDSTAFGNLATKATLPTEKDFFTVLAQDCITIEQELHDHFLDHFKVKEATTKSPAIEKYTHFLLHHTTHSTYAVAAAALLPCFWVYSSIGKHVFTHSQDHNPYTKWIDTYKGGQYEAFTTAFIQIVERLATTATTTEKQEMQAAFAQATQLELDFFEESLLM